MARKDNLDRAKVRKNDEFYTRYEDIASELSHYRDVLAGKTIYCNCDDPEFSQFVAYFLSNFTALKLKRLLVSYYDTKQHPFSLDITENGKRVIKTYLKGNGSYDSPECTSLLDQCDIIITNPPFSTFVKFVSLIEEHGKDYIVLGNINAITYKGIITRFMEGRLWLGWTSPKTFMTPTHRMIGNVPTYWYRNIGERVRNPPLKLTKHYIPCMYPKYDDYDAIECENVNDIPYDYYGIISVPMTYIYISNPEQFEVLGDTRYHDGRYDKANDVNFINDNQSYRHILIRRKRK